MSDEEKLQVYVKQLETAVGRLTKEVELFHNSHIKLEAENARLKVVPKQEMGTRIEVKSSVCCPFLGGKCRCTIRDVATDCEGPGGEIPWDCPFRKGPVVVERKEDK